MKKLVSAVLATAVFVSLSASAANVLKVSESVEINAPAEIVWGLAVVNNRMKVPIKLT